MTQTIWDKTFCKHEHTCINEKETCLNCGTVIPNLSLAASALTDMAQILGLTDKITAKHLPGQHDQMSHGVGGGGGDSDSGGGGGSSHSSGGSGGGGSPRSASGGESAGGGGGNVSATIRKAREAAKPHEDKMRKMSDKEEMIMFDKNGKILKIKTGGSSSVEVTYDEAKAMAGGMFSHNHPKGSSFSIEDITVAQKGRMQEIKVVGVGQPYDYYLRPGKKKFADWDLPSVKERYNARKSEIQSMFYSKINSGAMTTKEANANHHHEVMLLLANDLSWEYERVAAK